MFIKTIKFGEIEIDDSLIFEFVDPTLGYEDIKNYTIIDAQKDSPFKWLQATERPDVSFPVSIPLFFDIDYEFQIPEESQKKLKIENPDDLLILNIVNIPQANPKLATINLLGPIVINISNKKAAQLVLNSDKYSVRHKIFQEKEKNEQTKNHKEKIKK